MNEIATNSSEPVYQRLEIFCTRQNKKKNELLFFSSYKQRANQQKEQ